MRASLSRELRLPLTIPPCFLPEFLGVPGWDGLFDPDSREALGEPLAVGELFRLEPSSRCLYMLAVLEGEETWRVSGITIFKHQLKDARRLREGTPSFSAAATKKGAITITVSVFERLWSIPLSIEMIVERWEERRRWEESWGGCAK
mmetsp:Transcript_6993/g.17912  ORF Transcript_6993/g.17912 Transcript_6993/m.17912 type:complete len:147 (+) Transcript_6993:2565-3005(+)